MRHLSLLLSALLLSALSHATSTANITSISCSGSQSFDLTSNATWVCDGNFSLIGGSIDSDTGIAISALGSLFMENLIVSAPLIQLKALAGVLTIGGGVTMTADSINARVGTTTSPRITLSPGANLTLTTRDTHVVAQQPGDIALSPPGSIDLSGGTITRFPREPNNIPSYPGNIEISAGSGIVQSNGGNLALLSAVPEPDKFWTMLSGGFLLLAISRVRGRH